MRVIETAPSEYGLVVQLGERRSCKPDVTGSNPVYVHAATHVVIVKTGFVGF